MHGLTLKMSAFHPSLQRKAYRINFCLWRTTHTLNKQIQRFLCRFLAALSKPNLVWSSQFSFIIFFSSFVDFPILSAPSTLFSFSNPPLIISISNQLFQSTSQFIAEHSKVRLAIDLSPFFSVLFKKGKNKLIDKH